MTDLKQRSIARGMLLLTAAVFLSAIQILMTLGLMERLWPLKTMLPANASAEVLARFRPEREMLFCQIGIFVVLAGLAGGTIFLKQRLADDNFYIRLRFFVIVEAVLVFLLVSAQYQTIIYDYRPLIARQALAVLLVLCFLHKIFASGLQRAWARVWGFLIDPANATVLRCLGDVCVVVWLCALIYIPDHQAAVARIFIGEQACHIDHFIMAPGWAYLNGAIPYVDVLSEYGVGIPVVLTTLAKVFGPFSYESIYQTLVWVSMLYIVLYYIFLRFCLHNFLLSAAAVLLGIKFLFFYTMSYPLVFTYPASTPARYFLDVFCFLAVTAHITSGRKIFLLLGGTVCGLALFYMTTNGVCLALAFYTYGLLLLLRPDMRQLVWRGPKDTWGLLTIVLAAPFVWFGMYMLVVGKNIFSPLFWHNMRDFLAFISGGFIAGPYWTGLYSGQAFDVAVGCLIPAVYVLTVLIVGTNYFLGRARQYDLIAVMMSVYGLGVFHHHVSMSMANNYYTMGLCYVFVLAYWIKEGIDRLARPRRLAVTLVLAAVAAYALLTNHHYTSYPNIFNFSRNPMTDQMVAEPLPDRVGYFHHKFRRYTQEDKVAFNDLGERDEELYSEADFSSDEQLKKFYRYEYDFSRDAALIDKYTTRADQVPLISSFEVKMLMQADRKPYFYYFLLLDTRPMHMRLFGIANIFTTTHLKNILDQFERTKPRYVFMERIFLTHEVPQKYYYELYGLMDILDYVNAHYHVVDQGQYLVALERKD